MRMHPTHDPVVIHATCRRTAGFGFEASCSEVSWRIFSRLWWPLGRTQPSTSRVPIKKFRKSGAIVGKLGD